MVRVDRREFLRGGAAAAVGVAAAVGGRGGLAQAVGGRVAGAGALDVPKDLLSRTFGPLRGKVEAAGALQRYPVIEDRAAWGAVPERVRTALVARAEVALAMPWPAMLATDELGFARKGNRSEFEALHFRRRGMLSALVLGECAEARGRFLDDVANGLWLICEETFWGVPAHLGAQRAGVGLADVEEPIVELFSAETAATLAWTVALLGARLDGVSKRLRPRVHAEAKRRVLDVYAAREDFGWMGLDGRPGKKKQKLNNWNPWINSNVLTAAMLLEVDGARRAELVAKVCRSLDAFLADYSPDGACEEGPGYWSRSAASYFDACETLVWMHGGAGSQVLRTPFVRAMGHYICDVHIAGNEYVNYGDAHADAAPEAELLYRFGEATGDAVLRDFGLFEERRRPSAFKGIGQGPDSLSRELLKVFAAAEMEKADAGEDALTRESWYPALGLMTAREHEGSSRGLYVAMQAASNGRPHGHNDSGSFLLYADGDPVLVDAGVEAYTAQTFSKDRYKIWTMRSGYHNLPTIGGVEQQAGDGFRAKVLGFAGGPERVDVRCDLAGAYPAEAGVERWVRTVSLDRARGWVEVREDFALRKPEDVELNLLCAKEPVVGEGSLQVGKVRVEFDGAALRAGVERLEMTDAGMRHAWGAALWRVKLASRGPVTAGKWVMRVRQ